MDTSKELGKFIGTNIANATSYKEDFIPTEEITDLTLYAIESVDLVGSYLVSSVLYSSVFTVYHPVYGIVGSTMSPVGAGTILGSGLLSSGFL
jgi:hypothetical protein